MESRFLLRSRWSNAAHEAAFRTQYQSAGQALVGCSVLPSRDGSGPGGIFHWRACLGVICLHEESIDHDLVDNAAQFRYGGTWNTLGHFIPSFWPPAMSHLSRSSSRCVLSLY